MLLRNLKPFFSLSFLSHTPGRHWLQSMALKFILLSLVLTWFIVRSVSTLPRSFFPRYHLIFDRDVEITGLGKGGVRTRNFLCFFDPCQFLFTIQSSSAANGHVSSCWHPVTCIAQASQGTFFCREGMVILFYFFNGHTVKCTFFSFRV